MISFEKGDIFASKAQALVNPVNCRGLMGKGLALEFKRRYPRMFREYAELCRKGALKPGRVQIHAGPEPPAIISFPTKDDWRSPSRMEWIQEGLQDLKRGMEAAGLESVAIPALGSGLGGLPWPEVRAAIVSVLQDADFITEVYEPGLR